MFFIKRLTILIKKLYEELIIYVSPFNLNYLWSLGSMAVFCLFIQIITGVFLSMYYKADIVLAMWSVEYIMREVNYGWLIRYIHMNGASIFFLVVYLHMFKHMLFGSYIYPRQMIWVTGVIMLILMIATAFMGYVLPWGQMSLWGATVITNIFTAVPLIGQDFVIWLWGGFAVDNATLSRFYSLHFLFPFLILGLTIIHLIYLHEFGSNNIIGIITRQDNMNFFPAYIGKDFYSWQYLILCFSIIIFFSPDYLGHPDNYIFGNSLITPVHIVPEWYFLPLYAILRSIPSKIGGLIVLILAILALLCLPWITGAFQFIRSILNKFYLKIIMPLFIFNCILLGIIGGLPVEEPYYSLGQLSTFTYFLFFLLFFFFNFVELNILKIKYVNK